MNKRILSILMPALALTLGLGATHATAQGSSPEGSFTIEQGTSAYANWSSCTPVAEPTACTSTELFVFEGQQRSSDDDPFRGTRVCLNMETFPVNSSDPTYSYETGCATVPHRNLVVLDLSSATLRSTTVTLDKYRCDQACLLISSRDVPIAARWTAGGDVHDFNNHYKVKAGNCTETFKSIGKSRMAVATGTLNDTALGDSSHAFLQKALYDVEISCH